MTTWQHLIRELPNFEPATHGPARLRQSRPLNAEGERGYGGSRGDPFG